MIGPVVNYAAEAWTPVKDDINSQGKEIVNEKTILRRIYVPIKEGDAWKPKKSREIA